MYCCAALNGTLTQDGLNGFCDCDARVGSAQPLQFGGDASAITTIGVTDSLIATTTPQQSSAITTIGVTGSMIATTTPQQSSAITTIGVTGSMIATTTPQQSSAITTLIVVSTTQRPSPISSSTYTVSSAASSSEEATNPNTGTEPTGSSMPKPVKTVYPHHDRAVIVGASVGTSIALICLAALGFCIFYRKLQGHRDQSRKSKVNPHLSSSDPYPDPGVQELFGGQKVQELPAELVRYELTGDVAHHELPSP